MSKIIFLDVDGVLNNDNTVYVTASNVTFVDPVLLRKLKRIVAATDAKIVLSSSWREGAYPDATPLDKRDYEELKEVLEINDTPIMDVTERMKIATKNRGEEIDAWLAAHPECERYVILDDCPSTQFPNNKQYFVQTNYRKGIQEKDVKEAIKILKGED